MSDNQIIDINLIRRPAYPDRRAFSDEAMSNLMDSMQSIGLLHAIAIKPLDDGYELISGDRRLTAALALGWTEIWCTIHANLNALEVCVMRAQENLQRQNLSPMEEAFAVQRVHNDHKLTVMAISELFGRSYSWVSARLSLCDMSESLRDSVHNSTLGIGHALALASVPDDATRESMHDLCVSSGATLPVLLGWIKDYNLEAHGQPAVDSNEGLTQSASAIAPKVIECTICTQPEELINLAWRPICRHCLRVSEE